MSNIIKHFTINSSKEAVEIYVFFENNLQKRRTIKVFD